MRWDDKLLAVVVIAVVVMVVGGLTTLGVVAWQNAQDKRACRQAGGEVRETSGGEWRCAASAPALEHAP